MFRYEFGLVNSLEEHKRKDELPVPRVLFGQNTNKDNFELSSDSKLWQINQENSDRIPVHLTIEYVERRSSLRFARTYMLSNCAVNYMKGFELDSDDRERRVNPNAQFNEQAAYFLVHSYISLIKAFNYIKELYFSGKIEMSQLHKIGYACFIKVCTEELNLEIDELKNIFTPKDFSIDLIRYNAMGDEVKSKSPTFCVLHMLRIQQKNIKVNDSADNLGSILFADSFYQSSGKSLNITQNVPSLLSFYTTYKHYSHLSSTWFTNKGVNCERMGDRLFTLEPTNGFYPVKKAHKGALGGFMLEGKLIVYEKAIIFEDRNMHNFVVGLEDIEKVVFHIGKETWMEVLVNDNSSFPMNTIAESRVAINIKNTLYSKNLNVL